MNYTNILKEQLGIHPSTARQILIKKLVFEYIVKVNNKCFRCGEEMSLEDYSIEHIIPWRHAENAYELFFDLDNIAFSHTSCNYKATRAANEQGLLNIKNKSKKLRRMHTSDGQVCSRCKIFKNYTEFGNNKYRWNKYAATCKICRRLERKNNRPK